MKHNILGVIFVGMITAVAMFLAQTQWAIDYHLSPLVLVILLGCLFGNTLYNKVEMYIHPGVAFSKSVLLRIGIVLYGFNLTLQDISQVGVNAIFTDTILLISTFCITCFLGIRLLKLDKQVVYLTATGCSICGVAAILGAQSVVKADSHKVAVAVALIVIFGTIAMFLYPWLYGVMPLTEQQFGIYIGSTVHEVAQVYSAGKMLNSSLADTAVISKMIRVMMLAPFLICLSLYLQKSQKSQQKFTIPWFALLFIIASLINSTGWISESNVKVLRQGSVLALMMAMAAMGLTTQVKAVRQAGIKPLILGGSVFLWLVLWGAGINYMMQLFFS